MKQYDAMFNDCNYNNQEIFSLPYDDEPSLYKWNLLNLCCSQIGDQNQAVSLNNDDSIIELMLNSNKRCEQLQTCFTLNDNKFTTSLQNNVCESFAYGCCH